MAVESFRNLSKRSTPPILLAHLRICALESRSIKTPPSMCTHATKMMWSGSDDDYVSDNNQPESEDWASEEDAVTPKPLRAGVAKAKKPPAPSQDRVKGARCVSSRADVNLTADSRAQSDFDAGSTRSDNRHAKRAKTADSNRTCCVRVRRECLSLQTYSTHTNCFVVLCANVVWVLQAAGKTLNQAQSNRRVAKLVIRVASLFLCLTDSRLAQSDACAAGASTQGQDTEDEETGAAAA